MRYKFNADTPPEPGWTWRRSAVIGLGAGSVIGAAVAIFFLSKIGMSEEEKPITDTNASLWQPSDVVYTPPAPMMQANPIAPETPMLPVAETPIVANEPPPVNEALESAKRGSFGTYSPEGMQLADISGGGCRLPAGTKIHAQIETASISTNASVVTARVSYDVLGEGGCPGILAGAMMVGNQQAGAEFGAERSNFAFHTIEQEGLPPINLESAAADAMGRGGVPGEVDRHTGMIATRVAIATITGIMDSAASAIVGWGGIPMRETSRAVDNWADQAINLAPTLSTDPSKRRVPVMIVLQKAIVL